MQTGTTSATDKVPGTQGWVAPGFESVRQAFADNFKRGDAYQEVGAALAVYRQGHCIVDLWGGHADRARTRPWQRDSLINVYSSSKGMVATLVAMLVDEGVLDYNDLVTRYWPEYAQAGKSDTTIAQLLSHQSGLNGFAAPTTTGDLYDWSACCAALANQAPNWPPGQVSSYHAMTWGYLVGEVLRRASGRTVGQLLTERIRVPLGAEVYIGLPESEEPCVAQMLAPIEPPDLSALTQPPQALMALVNPQLDPEIANARAWRVAQIPAANGQATAQGLARIFAALANGGELDGVRLLSRDGIVRMSARQADRADLLLGFVNNWALGMCYNQFGMFGPNSDAFGHAGWGGSFGCADLQSGIGVGYVCNQMGAQLVGDPRGVSLCQAVFNCL